MKNDVAPQFDVFGLSHHEHILYTNYSEIQWEEGKSVQGSFFLTIIGVT